MDAKQKDEQIEIQLEKAIKEGYTLESKADKGKKIRLNLHSKSQNGK